MGKDATPNEAPYLAQVRSRDMYGFRDEGVCGGALISERHVLTASHCLMNVEIENEDVVVILGSHLLFDIEEKSRQRILTKKFWIHENFSRETIENDIAIIELPIPAQLNNFVKIINISKRKCFDGETKSLFHGWGFYNNSGYTSDKLQAAKMKIVPFKECLKFKNNYWEALTKNNICAIGRNDKKIAKICNGDSGGPLVIESTKELIGIASYVNDARNGKKLSANICDSPTVPDVFTRVSSYLHWIREIIKNN